MKQKQWLRKKRLLKVWTIINTSIITLFVVIPSLLVILSLLGCGNKPAVVYKPVEVNMPVRCSVDLPPLPNLKDMPVDTMVTEVAKSLEMHRRALICCVHGKCDIN